MFGMLYRSWFIYVIIVINFFGTLWGFQWYNQQLAATPWWWWPIVPDSPLSSGLFTLALFLSVRNMRVKWFHLLASFLSIKYGIWAVAVISDYWLNGGLVQITEVMLFISHLGMAAEAIIYLPLAWPEKNTWIPFVMYTWINDGADYIFAKHPYLFYDGQEPFGLTMAILLSTILSISTIVLSRWNRDINYEGLTGKG